MFTTKRHPLVVSVKRHASEKMKQVCRSITHLQVLFVLLVTASVLVEAQSASQVEKLRERTLRKMNVTRTMAQNAVKKANFTPPTSVRHLCLHKQRNGNAMVSTIPRGHTCGGFSSGTVQQKDKPTCPSNIVDASKAVRKALGINDKDKEWGWIDVPWTMLFYFELFTLLVEKDPGNKPVQLEHTRNV
ncbi:unnamed protein product [Dovyalis caffra]|uniref:Uncharacterized protein n=1 Tax=Dovyalis caffra TaxID=77055 RepID=A0AAV1RIG6_9ROSI|nr:unnamed protein product [Dovyalis caffra]